MEWLQADALAVPRAAESFDGAVMAYGLRNLPDPLAGLRELRRLLHRDGRAAVCLCGRWYRLEFVKLSVTFFTEWGPAAWICYPA